MIYVSEIRLYSGKQGRPGRGQKHEYSITHVKSALSTKDGKVSCLLFSLDKCQAKQTYYEIGFMRTLGYEAPSIPTREGSTGQFDTADPFSFSRYRKLRALMHSSIVDNYSSR
jgi:hypothetical protein